jgi:spermidine synthase
VNRRPLQWPLLLLFIGSGCAALIYEIVWLQLLQLVIGLTNVSLGILLGTFMGGMCLGSLLLPRFISAKRHPLRVYAALELGIGAIGIALLFLLPLIERVYTSGLGGIFSRAIVAGICLLPPTILMGATLPAIARGIESTPQGVSHLGFFYAGNLLGAVFGCLLAGFYLLRVFDMATATYVAAAINAAVAILAILFAIKSPHQEPAAQTNATPSTSGSNKVIYFCIALSGFAALGAEVVWTRLLSMLLGGTTYTFSIILAVFLIGLGIGSNVASFIASRIARPRLAFGICQGLLLFACAWAGYALMGSLPNWPINPSLSTAPLFNFHLDLARCFWAILPATILWGASFPLALASVAGSETDAGRMVGRLYAANTVGAIIGALAFSLYVFPSFGSHTSQQILIIIPTLAALLLFANQIPFPRFMLASSAAIAALVLFTVKTPELPWGLAAYGRYIATYAHRFAPGIVAEKDIPVHTPHEIFCEYLGEGMNGTVAVTKFYNGARNFHSAGKVQASNDQRDMRLQRMLGHLSALAHPNPESVLVVACGAGVTAGTFTQHPETKHIVICDIEPLVPKHVAPLFADNNFNVVNDPRTKVISDDGRHFIRTTKEKFDIITSDPIDPWFKGCAALNTVEYYEMCKAHLKPGGVMSLWLPLYECDIASAKSLIATFFKVFPHAIMWANDDDEGLGYDAVLFAQVDGTNFDLDKLEARLNRPDYAPVKKSLADVGFRSALSLLTTYAGQARRPHRMDQGRRTEHRRQPAPPVPRRLVLQSPRRNRDPRANRPLLQIPRKHFPRRKRPQTHAKNSPHRREPLDEKPID